MLSLVSKPSCENIREEGLVRFPQAVSGTKSLALLRSGARNSTANLRQKGDIYRYTSAESKVWLPQEQVTRVEELVRPVRPWPDHSFFVDSSLRTTLRMCMRSCSEMASCTPVASVGEPSSRLGLPDVAKRPNV